jgi:hypothetical protein
LDALSGKYLLDDLEGVWVLDVNANNVFQIFDTFASSMLPCEEDDIRVPFERNHKLIGVTGL